MNRGRSLVILLVLALGLGAYIYFVESKKNPDDTAKPKDKVFALETGKVSEIEVHTPAGEVTTIRKSGDDWQVVAPITAAADRNNASALASALETMAVDSTLDENPPSVAQFGLDPVHFSVAYKAGDATPHRLNLGNKTPTGSDYYARVEGQTKVILIPVADGDALNRTTFDLRDKTVLAFARENVDSVSLEPAGAPHVALAKKGGDWSVAAPIAVKAESSSVDTLVTRVADAQLKAVVAGDSGPVPAKDLATYGLDKPKLTVVIGAGSTRASLAIGGKRDASTIYARDLSKSAVFAVESSLLADLNKTADDLRLKDLFAFKSSTVTTIDLTRGGTTYSFTRTKTGTGDAATDVWKETKPQAKDVNLTGMTDFLNSLSALRADSFVAKAAGGSDELGVAARSGEGAAQTQEIVSFKKSGNTVQAILANQPGAAVVTTADFDKALSQFKELLGIK